MKVNTLASAGLLITHTIVGGGCNNRSDVGPTPLVRSVSVIGASEVAPGTSMQLRAQAELADGRTNDVTSQATWMSSNPAALTVSNLGVVTAHAQGEATVTASMPGANGTIEVIVVPVGTFRLTGQVADVDLSSFGIYGAEIELTGSAGPLRTTSDLTGKFKFYGVGGVVELRVTTDGYRPYEQTLTVAAHQDIKVVLAPAVPRLDISGTYALTITAASECAGSLPAEARQRSYTAAVTQRGPLVEVSLLGGTFAQTTLPHNRIEGDFRSDRIRFNLDAYLDNSLPYPMVEQVPPFWYVPSGTATVSPSTDRMAGSLDGSIEVGDITGFGFRPSAACRSSSHQFVLAR